MKNSIMYEPYPLMFHVVSAAELSYFRRERVHYFALIHHSELLAAQDRAICIFFDMVRWLNVDYNAGRFKVVIALEALMEFEGDVTGQ